MSSVWELDQSCTSGEERELWKGEGRPFQEEKSRNKRVEITGMLGNQQSGDLTAECVGGAGGLEMPPGTRGWSLPGQN